MLNTILIAVILINPHSIIGDTDRPQQALKIQRFTASIFATNQPFNRSIACDWLSRSKFQKKLCTHRKGLPQILDDSRHLAIQQCELKFQYEHWNCSKRDAFLKRVYRETALMQSMSASAVAYSIARACGEGRLPNCKCGEHGGGEVGANAHFKWAGCGHNAKFAKRFTRKFLQVQRTDDVTRAVIKNNLELGMRVTLSKLRKNCKCHGISGSCSMKICWNELRPFNETSENLKMLYHKAMKIEPKNNYAGIKRRYSKRLHYLEESPNFCEESLGRECMNEENCATICCGQRFRVNAMSKLEPCECRWQYPSYSLACKNCTKFYKKLVCE